MRTKNVLGISTLIAVVVAVSILVALSATASVADIDVNDGESIQAAINIASNYDTLNRLPQPQPICGTDTVNIVPTKAGSTEMAADRKPNNVPPDIEKITFVHYAKSNANSKPDWDDTVDKYKFLRGGLKWLETMTYEVNTDGSGLTDTAAVVAALEASLNTWDLKTGSELFGNTIGTTTEGYSSCDETNRITWGDFGDSRIIAQNSIWFNPRTKELVESDVVFNRAYTWSVDTVCANDAMDLQNIATHEFGHNGLNDLYNPPSIALTMYGYSGHGETYKRDLGTGDISGIQALYGGV